MVFTGKDSYGWDNMKASYAWKVATLILGGLCGMEMALCENAQYTVNNKRSLCVDFIVNVSDDYDYISKPECRTNVGASGWSAYGTPCPSNFYVNSWQRLNISGNLAQLKLNKGKVRVSILDTLQMQTLADRQIPSEFDWDRANKALMKQEKITFFTPPSGSRSPSEYLTAQIHKILSDPPCVDSTEEPIKIIIVVSSESKMQLSKDVPLKKVLPINKDTVRFFYFCLTNGYRKDDVYKIIKPAKPQKFMNVSLWPNFDKALAKLISDLEQY